MHDAHSSPGPEKAENASLAEIGPRPGATVSKSQFARMVGISPSRVSQMVQAGLPVEINGRIDVARGRCWIADNVDQGRSEAQKGSIATGQTSFRFGSGDEKRAIEIELSRIELEKMRGSLVDKVLVERAIFAAARSERDAWLTWPLRIGADFAAEIGVEEAVLLPVLKRLVRDQLHSLAEIDLEIR